MFVQNAVESKICEMEFQSEPRYKIKWYSNDYAEKGKVKRFSWSKSVVSTFR